MKIVGLTGGIGSGKSTVLNFFKKQGVPIYIADIEAKKIMHNSIEVVSSVSKLFGDQAYVNGELNRAYIANIVFNDKGKLKQLNEIVHPAVHKHFQEFTNQQNAKYIVYESAVLFENANESICDIIVLITAPEKVRIERVQKRDASTVAEIKARIKNQLSDKEKISKSDYIIENIELKETEQEVMKIHQLLMND
mgnify:CR=1 FL=1